MTELTDAHVRELARLHYRYGDAPRLLIDRMRNTGWTVEPPHDRTLDPPPDPPPYTAADSNWCAIAQAVGTLHPDTQPTDRYRLVDAILTAIDERVAACDVRLYRLRDRVDWLTEVIPAARDQEVHTDVFAPGHGIHRLRINHQCVNCGLVEATDGDDPPGWRDATHCSDGCYYAAADNDGRCGHHTDAECPACAPWPTTPPRNVADPHGGGQRGNRHND